MAGLFRETFLADGQLGSAQTSPNNAGFAALTGFTSLALIVLLAHRPRGHRWPLSLLAELLLIISVLSAAIAIGHELLTDDLCQRRLPVSNRPERETTS